MANQHIRSETFLRWGDILDRAYRLDNHDEVLAEFNHRISAIDLQGGHPRDASDERYALCTRVMQEVMGEKEVEVTLDAQADEYEECMRAQELMETL
jgi:hypothetical protein